MADSPKYENVEFDWIQLSNEIAPEDDGFMKKTVKKFKENPAVPIGKLTLSTLFYWNLQLVFLVNNFDMVFYFLGAFGAVGALSYGLYSMVNGNQLHSQYSVGVGIIRLCYH